MLKKEIKFIDFNDQPATETLYFNISKSELLEMELSTDEGFSETLKNLVSSQNMRELIHHFKKIILDAYGERSADGKRFIKSQQLRDEFQQTAAYNALFMELATDDNAALTFIRGVLPVDMLNELDKELKEAAKSSPLSTSAELPTPTQT